MSLKSERNASTVSSVPLKPSSRYIHVYIPVNIFMHICVYHLDSQQGPVLWVAPPHMLHPLGEMCPETQHRSEHIHEPVTCTWCSFKRQLSSFV